MFVIIGYIVVVASVIGGYAMAGGHVSALFQPLELLMIGGAAFGAFIVANPGKDLKACMAALPSVFKGSKYTKERYLSVMAMLYDILSKARKEGLMAIENDVEQPESSPLFSRYPAHSIQKMADGLPAFGIVAAVMGVVHTMGSVGQPPAILGEMIAHALVGTFLGILMAYGFVGPLADVLTQKTNEAAKELQCVKVTLLASMQGYAPAICVEFGRKVLYSTERPGFAELEGHVKQKRA